MIILWKTSNFFFLIQRDTYDMVLWYLYVAQCSDGSLYAGVSTDVGRRIRTHNIGKGAKYTRGRRPVKLVYQRLCGNMPDALKAERAFKKLPRSRKLKIITVEGSTL